MSIPFNLSPLGMVGTGILPVGYMAAEFLESTGYMRIDTGILPENSVGLYARAGLTKKFDGYVAGVHDSTLSPIQHVGLGRYIPGHFIAPTWANGTVDFIRIPSDAPFGFFETELNFLNSRKARLTAPGLNWESAGLLKNFDFTTQKAITLGWKNGLGGYAWQGQICCVKISNGEEIICDFVPVIDKRGVPCMFDRVSKQPFYSEFTGAAIVGMNLEQARKLCKLPAGGGEMTVSLPWEAGVDAQVQEALAKVTENGWTVVVQYREPEAATENIAVDFLEGTGTQWVESNAYLSKLHDIDLEVADLLGTQAWGREDGGFCLSMGMQSYGIRFIYANGGYKEVRLTQLSGRTLIQKRGNVFSMNGVSATADFSESTMVSTKPVRIFSYQGKAPYIAKGKWYKQVVYLNGEMVQDVRMALDVSGVPCMHDAVSGENFYNSGSGVFIAGFESTEKAALGLAKLPVVEAGELTVSLPAEAQDEATRVPAAIEVARQRGWTIITQYRED